MQLRNFGEEMMARLGDIARRRWGRRPRGWIRRPRGATIVEYLVILVLGVLVLLGALQLFGGGIHSQLENATDYLATVTSDGDQRGAVGDGGARGERSSSRGGDSGTSDSVAAGGDDSGAGGMYVDDGGREIQPIEGGQREETEGSVGGVNPLVILLLLGGVLFLGYVVFRND